MPKTIRIGLCSTCHTAPRVSYASYCKPCNSKRQVEYARRTKYKSIKTYQNKLADFIRISKDKPCKDCKVKYPHFVMDYDHIHGKKSFNLSLAANRRYSMIRVLAEIDKCEIVCSNCHRVRTATRKQN